MILMQELVKSTEKVEKRLSMKLQSRLLYLLLKCPLMQDRDCECNRVERGKLVGHGGYILMMKMLFCG